MTFILRKIIKNDAMINDPHEVYNWRVYAVAASVSYEFSLIVSLYTLEWRGTNLRWPGLFWRHVFRMGQRRYRWCY